MTKTKINIFTENTYKQWDIDEKKAIRVAKKVLQFYMAEILEQSCLNDKKFDTISFDFLFCDGEKTHQINQEYRHKNSAADIITFAIFADTTEDEKFIFDGEINLGEIIIALDKVIETAAEKGVEPKDELYFLISHGIMHLLGFDHQSETEYNFVVGMQKKALDYVKI